MVLLLAVQADSTPHVLINRCLSVTALGFVSITDMNAKPTSYTKSDDDFPL